MSYTDMVRKGASDTEIREYLVDGDMTAITIRIPRNLRESAKEAAALKGMSFSALIRKCLIDELTKEA
jgi:predicted DNA binding CopG/RHH family protein